MLGFNESTKTTESGKPHTFSFISTWFDTDKNQLKRLKSGFVFPNNQKKNSTNMKNHVSIKLTLKK